MLMFLYFQILYFFGIFELLKNMCHTTRAVRQTLKGKKIIFELIGKMSCDASGQTDTINEREPFFGFFLLFGIFIIL